VDPIQPLFPDVAVFRVSDDGTNLSIDGGSQTVQVGGLVICKREGDANTKPATMTIEDESSVFWLRQKATVGFPAIAIAIAETDSKGTKVHATAARRTATNVAAVLIVEAKQNVPVRKQRATTKKKAARKPAKRAGKKPSK